MWCLAGRRRTAAQLERLLDDPYPLAQLMARAALGRQESRGVRQRSDLPRRDLSLDSVHLVIDGEGRMRDESWR
jgi:succinate dehydrogenase/fumarate reductase flavoprotein subunit